MIKEGWSKPQLIVLVRNHPEETVLASGCKTPGRSGPKWTNSCVNPAGNNPCHVTINAS